MSRLQYASSAARSVSRSSRDGVLVPDELREQLPAGDLPEHARIHDDDPRPTFVGHYWERGAPTPYSKRVACVDYSAGKGGPPRG